MYPSPVPKTRKWQKRRMTRRVSRTMVGQTRPTISNAEWPKVGLRLPISVILSENTPLTTIDPLPPEQKVVSSNLTERTNSFNQL